MLFRLTWQCVWSFQGVLCLGREEEKLEAPLGSCGRGQPSSSERENCHAFPSSSLGQTSEFRICTTECNRKTAVSGIIWPVLFVAHSTLLYSQVRFCPSKLQEFWNKLKAEQQKSSSLWNTWYRRTHLHLLVCEYTSWPSVLCGIQGRCLQV